jgi:hypothetical protein
MLPALAVVLAAASQPPPAVPVDAISGVIEAFRTHQVVALSDSYRDERAHAFLLSLVRDPRFSAVVDDIVVEFGTARYQDVIDRFDRGEDVPYDTLRRVWQDATMPHRANDYPINEEFFRAVRTLNATLSPDRRLRLLLGEPPIDWDKVRTRDDHSKWLAMRDAFPAALIQTEVIAKERRALVVYGSLHFQPKNIQSNFDMEDWRAQTIVSLIERAGPTRVFTIWGFSDVASIQPDAASWRAPSLARLRGTELGAVDASRYVPWIKSRFAVEDGKMVPVPGNQWRKLRADDQIDAILYLGGPSNATMSQWSPALCADTSYIEMRLKRIAIVGPPMEAKNLKKYCASVAKPELPSLPAVPVEPIPAILDAFRSHRVVALGEGRHGNEQGHAFRLSLIRDPRFAAAVNDIVVECGNARYQETMDRFVRGENVPYESLRLVWQNTTQPHAGCDRPIYEDFYRTVRAVNARLPRDRQLRVLLGDPPVDWDSADVKRDREKWMQERDRYPADVIRRDVLAKQRRGLIIYGDGHLQRKQLLANYEMTHPLAQTIVSLLEGSEKTRVFTIKTEAGIDLQKLQADVGSWPKPSLAIVRGTVLGAADYAAYNPAVTSRFRVLDGKLVAIPRDEWRTLRMEEQFDAVLYLGPPSAITISRLSPTLCGDPAYMRMRLGRIASEGPRFEADRLKEYCASLAAKEE